MAQSWLALHSAVRRAFGILYTERHRWTARNLQEQIKWYPFNGHHEIGSKLLPKVIFRTCTPYNHMVNLVRTTAKRRYQVSTSMQGVH